MLNQTSSTVIARIVLLAGILLAITLLASRSFFPAFAQEANKLPDDPISFEENSDDSVAVYTATDAEQENLVWGLLEDGGDYPDDEQFSIDNGVLTFENGPPDYEDAQDGDTDNTYMVIVVVKAGDGNAATMTHQPVVVTVTNVEEEGTVELSRPQPKSGVMLTATLTDDDGSISEQGMRNPTDVNFANNPLAWQWATSTSAEGPWNDIDGAVTAEYEPKDNDAGMYLRAMATYRDGHGEDDPFTDDVDESVETASAVSANPVLMSDYTNIAPEFSDQDPDADGVQNDMATREIAENSAAGTNVGAPLTATDRGADGNLETLFYTLEDDDSDSAVNDHALFDINSSTGQIVVGTDAEVDYEDQANDDLQYKVVVSAADPSDSSITINVTIKVTDVLEAPEFGRTDVDNEQNLVARTINEFDVDVDALANYPRDIATYEATDEDLESTLKWTLSGSDASRFEFSDNDSCSAGMSSAEGSSAVLCIKTPPNYEAPNDSGRNRVYDIRVIVTDNDGLNASTNVKITVDNVEEETTLKLTNLQPQVGTPFRAELKDPDGNARVTWTWATSTSASDVIAGATSNSYTPKVGDVDETLYVTAVYTDGHGPEETPLEAQSTNRVKAADPDRNEAPVFGDRSPASSRAENIPISANTVLYILTVTDDQDASVPDVLTFSLLEELDWSFFTIAPSAASVSVLVRESVTPDYEAKRSYRAKVRVTDPSGSSDTATVTLNIQDVNEPPVIASIETMIDYDENGTGPVATLSASDPEGANIQWSLKSDANEHEEAFSITRGVLKFNNSPDFEDPTFVNDQGQTVTVSNNEYKVTVQASDGSPNPTEVMLTVEVINVDEPGVVELSTSQPKDGVDFVASLTDPDGSQTNTTWQWATSTSANGPWNDIANAATATYAPTPDDVGMYLRATASYSDGQSPSDDANTPDVDESLEKASVVSDNPVVVADYTNMVPIFPDQDPATPDRQNATTTRVVNENASAGKAIGAPVSASDKGADGREETLFYTLSDDDLVPRVEDTAFEIDSGTGQIKVKSNADIDFEDQDNDDHEYKVVVTATDPSNEDSTIKVTIRVRNLNEAPEIDEATQTDGLSARSVDENFGTTEVLSTYRAMDDEDVEADLEWTKSGPDGDRFEITDNTTDCNGRSCVDLRFKDSPNLESPTDANRDNVYNVTLNVTDRHGNTTSRDVAITVENEGELGTVSLSTRQPTVGVPITAALSDPDGGVRDVEWQWQYVETDADIGDAISNAYTPVTTEATGNLTLRVVATYRDAASEDNQFTLGDESLVTATGTASSMVIATIANNQPPVFPDQDDDTPGDQSDRATRSVHENTVPGNSNNPVDTGAVANPDGNVGDAVTANDSDQEHADKLTYKLGGTDADLFTMASSSGQIIVGEGTELDFESKNSYTVTVTVTDPEGASDSIIVTINIRDVDEAPEVSKRGLAVSGSRSVSYPENSTGDVATFTATGSDSAGASWSLEGPDSGAFAISSGILAFRSPPNYESATDQNGDSAYEVTVKATSGNLMATRSVTVNVTNVDEPGTVNISSPNNEVKVGVQLTAELDDGDEETVIGWQWASGGSNTGPWSNISGATNNTYTPVEGDEGNYLRATVTYNDPLGSGKTLSAVTSDAVEAAPTGGTPGTVSLSQSNGLVSGDPVTATLTDADNPVNHAWRWQRSANGSTNWSNISGATSASYTTTAADAGNYLRATVTYDDSSGTGLTLDASTSSAVKLHRYDGNANGAIERNEVIEAINDYLFGTGTERGEVIEVINLYLFG